MLLLLLIGPPALALDLDLLLEQEAGRSQGPAVRLHIAGRDSEALRPILPPVADKEPWSGARGAPPPAGAADLPGAAAGALSGKAVYISQCHGWKWFDSLGRFSTQRGNLYDTVEDFHNPEGTNQFLVRYLENAGARVFTTRERDQNPRMAISDNDGDGYAETGSGFVNGPAGFAEAGTYPRGVDPFDEGSTRRFPADGGGVATWRPEIPQDGVYAVYLSWDSASDHAREAHYRIHHPGGVIDRVYDQTVHGSTWQYAEQLWLPAGVDGLRVELIADSDEAGRWLSADAVRVGGGMDEIERNGAITGRPRWESSAMHYAQFNGAPTSVYDAAGDDSDPSARSRWAAWEHPTGEPAVYLSWHSNAGGGTGTSTYIYEGSATPVDGSDVLGAYLQDELVETIRDGWDPSWTDRGVRTASFAELNPSYNAEMPAALVELAFHDHPVDVELLKEPGFRRDSARAMARAIVRYFADTDGVSPHFQPEPPVDVALLHGDGGQLVLSWSAGPSGAPLGDPSSGYIVYRSADGRSWDNGSPVGAALQVELPAITGEVVYAQVVAENEGGLSFPSEVVGARRSPLGQAEVLVVLGFDRLRASNLPWEPVGLTVGDVRRMDLPRVNPFDGVVAHGQAVAAAGWYFESAADERLAGLDLSRNRVLFWNAGEESSQDDTLTPAQQGIVAAFYGAGGALWFSGAELLWDLDARGDAADQAFLDGVLGARMAADDADSTDCVGEGLLEGLDLGFDEADGSPYPVEYPDVLATDDAPIARYATGGVAASLGEGRALFGMPFECIGDPAGRAEVAARLLPALVPGYLPPDPGGEDSGGGGDDGGAGGDGAGPGGDSASPDDSGDDGKQGRAGGGAGCGCAAGPGSAPGGALLGLLALLGLSARRRLS